MTGAAKLLSRSRHTVLAIWLLVAAGVAPLAAAPADTTRALPVVVITATRMPGTIDSTDRTVEVATPASLGLLASTSTTDLLRMTTLADVQDRGTFGIQGDLSMRGGTIGEALVLVDGLRMNDVQTSHHDLDIPLPLLAVGRIEAVPGPGSALYGSDAMGGVVNIVPGAAALPPLQLTLSIGEHNTQAVALAAHGALTAALDGMIAADYRRSDGFPHDSVDYTAANGYRYDTEYNVIDVYGHTTWRAASGDALHASLAYARKDFGAFGYYTPTPEHETTTALIASVDAEMHTASMDVLPRAYVREHTDHFILTITKPTLYVNDHTDRTVGAEVVMRWGAGAVRVVDGIEAAADHLNSVGQGVIPSGLGVHDRTRAAVYAQAQWRAGITQIDGGARLDWVSPFDPQLDPSLSIGLDALPGLRVYGSVARAFRAPNFTELYYVDPYNAGGPALQPETAISYELGTRYAPGTPTWASAALFLRQESNTIDFAKNTPTDSVTNAVNIPHSTVQGVELRAGADYAEPLGGVLRSARLGWTVMNATNDLPATAVPRYAGLRPRQMLTASLVVQLPAEVQATGQATYKLRTNANYTLIDASLSRAFVVGANTLTLGVHGTNLGNEVYTELPGVPMPRRWLFVDAAVGL